MSTRDRAIWNYAPELPVQSAPFLRRPLRPAEILRHVVRTWQPLTPRVLMLLVAIAIWHWFSPSMEEARDLRAGWIAEIWIRNVVILTVVAGGLHLYLQNRQGDELRYDGRPFGKNKRLFLFKDQVLDNMFLTLVPCGIIATGWEVMGWWAYANDVAPLITFTQNPIWFVVLLALIPLWSVLFFSAHHWLLHRGPVYKHVHSWHHKNVNIGAWSGLAMHPVEQIVLYSDVLLFLVLPSSPVHFLYAQMHHTIGAPMSHTGHDAVKLPRRLRFELGDFHHQLHHRFIECNYGGPESPIDDMLDSLHDGTPAGDAHIAERRRRLSASRRS